MLKLNKVANLSIGLLVVSILLIASQKTASAALVAGVPSCSDTEGVGKAWNYMQRGSLSVFDGTNSSIIVDSCEPDGRYLNEVYCLNNMPSTIRYRCPGACYNGACVTPSVITNVAKCSDSDGGEKSINYYKLGETSVTKNNQTVTASDSCFDQRYINEQYCLNGEAKTIKYRCPGVCYEGICTTLSAIKKCTDDEGGDKSLNYYKLGTLSVQQGFTNSTIKDECVDDRNLKENYCLNGEAKVATYRCPGVCNEGICTTATAVKTCTDSEGGDRSLNYYRLGSVSYRLNGINSTLSDSCIDSRYLSERYCISGEAKTATYRCPGICSQGVCMIPTNTDISIATTATTAVTDTGSGSSCSDSEGRDKSLNYYTFGTVVTYLNGASTNVINDSCEPGTRYLNEAYCLNGVAKTVRYRCPGICLNGICTTPTANTAN